MKFTTTVALVAFLGASSTSNVDGAKLNRVIGYGFGNANKKAQAGATAYKASISSQLNTLMDEGKKAQTSEGKEIIYQKITKLLEDTQTSSVFSGLKTEEQKNIRDLFTATYTGLHLQLAHKFGMIQAANAALPGPNVPVPHATVPVVHAVPVVPAVPVVHAVPVNGPASATSAQSPGQSKNSNADAEKEFADKFAAIGSDALEFGIFDASEYSTYINNEGVRLEDTHPFINKEQYIDASTQSDKKVALRMFPVKKKTEDGNFSSVTLKTGDLVTVLKVTTCTAGFQMVLVKKGSDERGWLNISYLKKKMIWVSRDPFLINGTPKFDLYSQENATNLEVAYARNEIRCKVHGETPVEWHGTVIFSNDASGTTGSKSVVGKQLSATAPKSDTGRLVARVPVYIHGDGKLQLDKNDFKVGMNNFKVRMTNEIIMNSAVEVGQSTPFY
jgi:hypothetical protein